MDLLALASAALGFSALAGLRFYLTVFALGFSIYMGWLPLTSEMEGLRILAHPVVLILAGVLVLVEFIADKIPWVDSLWDAIHTLIRPLGAALLSMGVVGLADPLVAACVALLGGGLALTTHVSKSSARLLVNTSPEPFSNSLASLLEDLLVLGGIVLIVVNPWLALALVLLFVALFVWLAPKICRHLYLTGRYLLLKIQSMAGPDDKIEQLPKISPSWVRIVLEENKQASEELGWIVPVVIRSVPGLPANRRAYLFRYAPQGRLGIVIKGREPAWISLTESLSHVESKMLFDELTLFKLGQKKNVQLRFPKSHRAYLDAVLRDLALEVKPE
jgi:uncharacterized membrane protein